MFVSKEFHRRQTTLLVIFNKYLQSYTYDTNISLKLIRHMSRNQLYYWKMYTYKFLFPYRLWLLLLSPLLLILLFSTKLLYILVIINKCTNVNPLFLYLTEHLIHLLSFPSLTLFCHCTIPFFPNLPLPLFYLTLSSQTFFSCIFLYNFSSVHQLNCLCFFLISLFLLM